MSWGTDFTADIFLNRLVFQNKYELESKIEEVEHDINVIEKQISMFCASTPRDIVSDDWKDDAIMFLEIKTRELFEEYRNLVRLHSDLCYYLETDPNFKQNDTKTN